MKQLLLIGLLISSNIYANSIYNINMDWMGLFPSISSDYIFEKTNFKYNIVKMGIGFRKANYCRDCAYGELLRKDRYYILPSISIYKEINSKKQKKESGYLFILGSDTFTVSHFKIDKFYNKSKNLFFKIGFGYGMIFSTTTHNTPFILPTIGVGMKI